MTCTNRVLRWCLMVAVTIAVPIAWNSDASFGVEPSEKGPPAKAVKYHGILVKRPRPGYLFDRFYNTWLDEATVESLGEFLAAQAKESGETADRLLLAFFHGKQGDDVRAIEEFRTALAHDPNNASAWYEKAVVEARVLDFETALSDLAQARDAEPDAKLAVRIAKLQGQLLVRNRQKDKALEVWRHLLAEQADDEELAEDVIELQINEGLYDEAAKLSNQLIERTKDPYLQVIRRLRLGDIQRRAGQRAEALETYRDTLAQVGFGTWLERQILAQIEEVFRREDNLQGLRKQYEKLLEAYSKRVGVRRAYARVLAELGDHDAAVQEFEAILKLTPGDRANREAFVELLAKADKLPQAIEQLDALVEQHPDDSELYVRLADLHHQEKDTETAAAAVDKYIAASDKSEYVYLRAARLLEQMKLPDAAGKKYTELVEAHPDSIAAREARAAFLYRVDDKDSAKDIWRSLAATSDVNQILRIAKTAAARHEHELAYELLGKHQQQFDDNGLYLGELIDAALALEKFSEAMPWVRQRVALAESTGELENALRQASKVIERAEKTVETISNLQAVEEPSVQQTCLLAELLDRTGDSQAADAALAELADRGELLAVSQQVRLAGQRRDWTAAAAATRRLINLPGGRKSRHVRRLVDFYQRDYQLKEALEWIDQWKKLSPGSTTPWLTEARLLQLSGNDQAAVETLRAAAREFDGSTEVRVRLAQLYTTAGKYADAQRIYWQQYEDSDDVAGKLRWVDQLAQLAEQQGQMDRLVERFEDRRRNNRMSIEPLLALAEIHRVGDNYEGRRQALTMAAKIKPDDLQLLTQIARIEEQEGHWERARSTLKRAADLDKTNRTQQQIARLHLEYGNPDDGFAILYELAGKEQSHPRDIEAIADAMIGTGEWQRAAEFLSARIQEHPDDYRLWYILGVAQEEVDQPMAAMQSLVHVLDAEKEVPGITTSVVAGRSMSTYMSMLAGLLPPESLEMFQVSQLRYTAYHHRQQRGGLRYSVSSSGRATNISMPPDVDTARYYALAHLVGVGQFMEDDQRLELQELLKRHDVADPEALMVACGGASPGQNNTAELLHRFPDRKAVLAFALLSSWGRAGLEPELAAKAFDMFREESPQLAVIAAVGAAAQDEQSAPLLEKALPLIEDVEQPNMMLMINVCMNLGGMPGANTGTSFLQEDHRQLLSQRLIEWYPSMRSAPQYGTAVFVYTLAALRSADAPDDYVAFLDDEVARWRTGGSYRQQQPNPYAGRSNNFLEPPSWPPLALADFPMLVLQTIHPNLQQNSPFGTQTVTSWTDEQLLKAIDGAKDPILRILLAAGLDRDELVDRELDMLMEAETPLLDAYLLAAARQAKQGHYEQASQLYAKARYLPMTRDVRRHVDSALVAVASEHLVEAGESECNGEVIQAGKNAALRLRHGRLDQNQRSKLVAALEGFGLETEAEKLDKQPVAAAVASPGRAYVASSSSQQIDRIQKLIGEGRREMAAKILAGELSGLARQAASMGQSWRTNRYQFQQIRQRIAGYHMTDDVLAVLDPEQSKNFHKIAQFALANEILEQNDEAIAAYRRAVQLRPKDDTYRVQLAFLLAEQEMDEATSQLQQLGKRSGAILQSELVGRIQDHESPLESRLAAAELGVAFLEEQSEETGIDVSWADNFCLMLASGWHHRQGQVPSLFVTESEASNNRRTPSEELLQRRAEIHQRLCRAMLRRPEMAEDGFTHLLAAAEAKDAVGDEFVELARDAILAAGQASKSNAALGTFQQTVHYSSNSTGVEVPMRSPVQYLARHAWRKQAWQLLDDGLVPKLQAAEGTDQVEQLEAVRKLYECPADKFADEARAYVRRTKLPRGRQGLKTHDDLAAIIIDVWQDRRLDVDLQPLVIKWTEDSLRQPNSYNSPDFLRRFCVALVERNRSQQVADFLEELAVIYVGPKEKRVELIRRHYQQSRISSGTPNAAMHALSRFVQKLLQDKRLIMPTVRFVGESKIDPILQNVDHFVRQTVSQFFQGSPEAIVESLQQMQLLENLDRLHAYPLPGESQDTLFAQVVKRLRGLGNDQRKAVAELLRARQPSKLGTRMLLAMVTSTPSREEVLDDIGQQMPQLESLDEDRRAGVVPLLAALVTSRNIKDSALSDEGRAALEWIEAQNSERHEEIIEKLLTAKRLEELGIQYYNADEWLARTLPDIVKSDPRHGVDVFFKVVELVEDHQRQQGHAYYSGESTGGAILERLLNRSSDQPLALASMSIDVLLDKRGMAVSLSGSRYHRLNQHLSSSLKKLLQQKSPDGEKSKAAKLERVCTEWHQQLTAVLGDLPTTILSGSLVAALRSADVKHFDEIVRWAEGASGEKRGTLAGDIGAAAQLVAAHKRPAKSRKNQQAEQKERSGQSGDHAESAGEKARYRMEDYHRYYLASVNDTERPLNWRMMVARHLYQQERDRLPAEAARALLELATTALNENVPLAGDQHSAMVANLLAMVSSDTNDRQTPAEAFAAAWKSRYLRPARRRNTSGGDIHSVTNHSILVQMLKVYLLLGDDTSVNQLLRYYDSQIGYRPDAAALLAGFGEHDRAAALIQKHWSRFQLSNVTSGLVVYDDELSNKLPGLYEELTAPDLRYFAGCLMAALSDPDPKPSRDFVDQDGRLRECARQFDGINFKLPRLKQRTLLVFARDSEAMRLLAGPLAEEAAKINLVQLVNLRNNSFDDSKTLVFIHLKETLRRGDTTPTARLLESLSESAGRQEWQIDHVLKDVAKIMYKEARDTADHWTPEAFAALTPSLRKLAIKPDLMYQSNPNDLDAMNVVAHLLSGKSDEFVDWIQSLSQEERERTHRRRLHDTICVAVARSCGDPDEDNLPRRAQLARELFRMLAANQWLVLTDNLRATFHGGASIAESLRKSKLLTREELLEHGPQLAEAVPQGGILWTLVAQRQEKAEQWQAAAESWKHVASELPRDSESERRRFESRSRNVAKASDLPDDYEILSQRARLNRAAALHKANLHDDAREVLQDVKSRSVPKKLQERVAKLEKALADESDAPESDAAPAEERK